MTDPLSQLHTAKDSQKHMLVIELTKEELDELIHLSEFASCEDNIAARLFDKLTAIKKSEHNENTNTNI